MTVCHQLKKEQVYTVVVLVPKKFISQNNHFWSHNKRNVFNELFREKKLVFASFKRSKNSSSLEGNHLQIIWSKKVDSNNMESFPYPLSPSRGAIKCNLLASIWNCLCNTFCRDFWSNQHTSEFCLIFDWIKVRKTRSWSY